MRVWVLTVFVILFTGSVVGKTCTSILPNTFGFPITFPSSGTQHVVFTDSITGQVTVSDTHLSRPIIIPNPLDFANAVFGLDGPMLFIGCSGVFPSRSGSLAQQDGIFAVKTTLTSNNGLLHIIVDARNNQSPNEQPCKSCPDDIHTVNTYDYNALTGAYTYSTKGDRNSSGRDPSNNVSYAFSSIETGTQSGIVPAIAIPLIPRFSEEEKADFALLSKAFGNYLKIILIIAKTPACIGLSLIVPCEEFAAAALTVAQAGKLATAILAADPIDSNYKVIQTPIFPPLPTLISDLSVTGDQSALLLTFLTNTVQIVGYTNAIITANNRFQGAAAAKDDLWEGRQLRAANYYAIQLSGLLSAQSLLRSRLQISLSHAGLPEFVITPQLVSAVDASLASEGFPPISTTALTQFGFSRDQILTLQIEVLNLSLATPLTLASPFSPSDLDVLTLKAAQSLLSFAADRNNDLRVDCADLNIIRSAFGRKEGQVGFDARADINADGLVDIRDLAFVSQRLPAGTVCH